MSIEQDAGIFVEGPKGRTISVNASGQLVATEAGPLEPYAFGPKGRALGVDANGRLGVIISSPATLIDSPTASGSLDMAGLRQFDVILDKNVVFTSFDNADPGARYMFILEQTGVGSFSVTWPDNVKWRGSGVAPDLTDASGSIDVVTMIYRNRTGDFLADAGLDFQ